MRRRMLGAVSLLILMLGVFGTFSGAASPSFSEITLPDIMQASLSTGRINGSNNLTNQIPTGTILMYQTDEGRYGVLEIASYSRDLTLNWRTYSADGSVYRSGNGLVIHGTWHCDLDRGVEGSASSDFQWSIVTSDERYIEPKNGARFAVTTTPQMLPVGPLLPPPVRAPYNIVPPRSITFVIPEVTLHFDLRTDLPWNQREWTQWGVYLPQPGTSDLLGMTMQCSCKFPYLQNWQVKPSNYWPYATQYLVSDPEKGNWENFALCIDVPNLAWGTAPGYNVSLVPSSVFASFRKGDGILVPASQKISIVPSPTLETGPVSAKGGTIRFPYEPYITFHQVAVEWFRWTGKARLRAGNVVLMPDLGSRWHSTNPNAIYIGSFLVDLLAGTVQHANWKSDGTCTLSPTLLAVTIDDGVDDFITLDPDLWW